MMCSSVEKDEGWGSMGANIPYTSMGREGGVVKGNIIDEKPWKNHLDGGKHSALESHSIHSKPSLLSSPLELQLI